MLKLKISRRNVPELVPFTVVYLYKEDEREAIRAAFPALFELRPSQLRLKNWAQVHVHSQEPGWNHDAPAYEDKHADTLIEVLPEFFEIESDWYMAVPTVLMSGWPRIKEAERSSGDPLDAPPPRGPSGHGSPKYFGHRSAGNWRGRRNQPPRPEPQVLLDPVLAVQGEPDRGVCSECPRYAHNAAGRCFFGDPICAKHVHTIAGPTFLQHLAAYLEENGESDDVPGRESSLPGDS